MLLSTDIWVAALFRRAELSGAYPMVIRKGDALFRVEDRATDCLPDIANCIDEYTAKIERVR